MSIQELIARIGEIDIRILLAIYLSPPLLVWLLSRCHRRGDGGYPPWRFFYSFLVYLVCIPGIFAAVLTAYSLFFIRQNLLQVNFVVYFLPLICMVATLILVGKQARWRELPGVDRLYALMIILGISMGMALFIQKTRVWIFFGGSFSALIVIALVCFALLKWASYMLFRSKDEPRVPSPYHDSFDSRSKGGGRPPSSRSRNKELERLKKELGIRNK